MLRLDLKRKSFGTQSVLRDIQVTLAQGERLAVLGPSGIGKSTLLRVIAGLDTRFDGTRTAADNIALMFQNPTLLTWRTAAQNLGIFHPQATETELHEALAQVGLADKAAAYPDQLSVGQQRRLALARSFVGKADLVLLDEPFTSLDPALRAEMIALTRCLLDCAGSTAVLVTHAADEAEALGALPRHLHFPPGKSGACFTEG